MCASDNRNSLLPTLLPWHLAYQCCPALSLESISLSTEVRLVSQRPPPTKQDVGLLLQLATQPYTFPDDGLYMYRPTELVPHAHSHREDCLKRWWSLIV